MRLHGIGGELRDVELQHLIARERVVLERILGVSRFAQIALGKRRCVDDDGAANLQVVHIDGERRGIHGDEDVDRVARCHHIGAAEMNLECRHTERGPGGRADFCGKVGERRKVAACERGLERKLTAGHLHPIAGVTRKTDDDRIADLASRARYRRGNHVSNLHDVTEHEPYVRGTLGQPPHVPGEPGAAIADQYPDLETA